MDAMAHLLSQFGAANEEPEPPALGTRRYLVSDVMQNRPEGDALQNWLKNNISDRHHQDWYRSLMEREANGKKFLPA